MSKKPPLILVCNDDGVTAPGIKALTEVASRFGRVVVVAPDKPQSGMGHAITINSTLRIQEYPRENPDIPIYSTTGTPVDCIKLAVKEILDHKPDLIVSGINHGSNASINVIYSGTMSAAIEGCMEGIPSVGFSLLDYSIDADFTTSQLVAHSVIEKILKNGLEKGVCLNVNIPKVRPSELAGIKVCRQADAHWEEVFDVRKDPSGKKYYWLAGHFENHDTGTDTDIHALEHNFASVVPVKYDLTAHQSIQKIQAYDFTLS